MVPFENDNLKAYALLLRIEIALRELLRMSLELEFGVKWRNRLPGELLKKIKQSQSDESRPQFGYVRLGPLYYLTFGELLILLQQKPGRVVVEKLGGDCVIKQIENIFIPRNAVCHSRPVSSVGLATIDTLYAEIETALTSDGLARLISKPDSGLTQDQAAAEMIPIFRDLIRELPNIPPSFVIPDVYQTVTSQFWWADDSLAGFNRSIIEAAISCIREYNALPSGVGCAANRQRLIEDRHVSTIVEQAIVELENLKK